MFVLSPTEQQLDAEGFHCYFLGPPVRHQLPVAEHLRTVALPRLDGLIADASGPLFDGSSREALERAIDETPPNVSMSWGNLARYLELAIGGPELPHTDRGDAPPAAVEHFSGVLRGFRNEYSRAELDK